MWIFPLCYCAWTLSAPGGADGENSSGKFATRFKSVESNCRMIWGDKGASVLES